MPVTGLYMARRVHSSAIPYIRAYGECVLNDVLPAFSNLSVRAEAIATAEFKRLGKRQTDENCDGDMGEEADAAQEMGQAFYNNMVAIRQTSLNLYATGLFHLLEQQLAEQCRDGSFDSQPMPTDTKLGGLKTWYLIHFDIDLSKLLTWPKIDQLRLLANTVKHGDGGSAKELKGIRPDIFQDPNLRELLAEFPQMYTSLPVRSPLAGEDIFVTDKIFSEFHEAATSFVAEIAAHFLKHKEDHYPKPRSSSIKPMPNVPRSKGTSRIRS